MSLSPSPTASTASASCPWRAQNARDAAPLVDTDRADGQRVSAVGGIPRQDRRGDRCEVSGDRRQHVASHSAHRERLHGLIDDDIVEVGADRPVGEVGDVVRVRGRPSTEPGIDLVVSEHTDARLRPVAAEHLEHDSGDRGLERVVVDRRPLVVADQRAVEQHGGQDEPVAAQHPPDGARSTGGGRDHRDARSVELVDGGERQGMHDAIDIPQRAVEIGHHQLDRHVHHHATYGSIVQRTS